MAQRQDFRRIGLLLPSSNSVQERDFYRVLPEDITLHVARMRLSNVEESPRAGDAGFNPQSRDRSS